MSKIRTAQEKFEYEFNNNLEASKHYLKKVHGVFVKAETKNIPKNKNNLEEYYVDEKTITDECGDNDNDDDNEEVSKTKKNIPVRKSTNNPSNYKIVMNTVPDAVESFIIGGIAEEEKNIDKKLKALLKFTGEIKRDSRERIKAILAMVLLRKFSREHILTSEEIYITLSELKRQFQERKISKKNSESVEESQEIE